MHCQSRRVVAAVYPCFGNFETILPKHGFQNRHLPRLSGALHFATPHPMLAEQSQP